MKPLLYLNVTAIALATLLPHADAQQILAPGPDNTTIADGESLSLNVSIGEIASNALDPFTIAIGGTLNNNFGRLDNNGTLNNDGTLTNSGTLNNDGTLTNDDGGTLTNFGTLNNNGTLNNHNNLNNYGTLNNYSGLTNNGTIDNTTAVVASGGGINNFGTLSNNGTINSSSAAISISGIQNHGTLINNGTINGSVDVKAGGILTGSGTIVGSVLLGGVIEPANSTGTITTSNQTWINGASYGWEVNDSDGTAGGAVGWDLINITATAQEGGELDLSQLTTGGFAIDIISLDALNDLGLAEGFDDPNAEYEFVILTAIGGITGFDAEDFVLNDDGFQNTGTWDWSIEQDGNNLVLSAGYTLVPEPSSLALLGMGGLGLLLRRKRS